MTVAVWTVLWVSNGKSYCVISATPELLDILANNCRLRLPLPTVSGYFESDCKRLDDYKFFLSFENSRCREYMTEKLWWNAYGKGAVPVVMVSTGWRKRNVPSSVVQARFR